MSMKIGNEMYCHECGSFQNITKTKRINEKTWGRYDAKGHLLDTKSPLNDWVIDDEKRVRANADAICNLGDEFAQETVDRFSKKKNYKIGEWNRVFGSYNKKQCYYYVKPVRQKDGSLKYKKRLEKI